MKVLLALALAAALATSPPAGATSLVEDCNGDDAKAAVTACSRLIAELELPSDKLSAALNNRGIAYAAAGIAELALADFVVAGRVDPANFLALNNLCHVWLDVDQPRRALAACNRAIDANPAFYEAFSNRSLAHRALGDLATALADATQAPTLNPSCPLTRANRGFLYEQAGRASEAIADYEAALQAMPDLALAKNGLARLRRGASADPAPPPLAHRLGQIEAARSVRPHHRDCPPTAGAH